MWFMEEPSQFPVGETAQSLDCSIMEKPHSGLDDCLRVLQACFRKRMSVVRRRGDVRRPVFIREERRPQSMFVFAARSNKSRKKVNEKRGRQV